jgi:hypothetical protein
VNNKVGTPDSAERGGQLDFFLTVITMMMIVTAHSLLKLTEGCIQLFI